MAFPMTNFPDWSALTPASAAEALPRLLKASEQSVAALEAAAPRDFESLMWALNDATRELWRVWGMVSHLTSVMNSEEWRQLEENFQPALVAFSLRVGQSRPLYDAAKALLDESTNFLSPVRRRILEKTVQAAEQSGVALDGAAKAQFNEIQTKLAKLAMDFSNAVMDATKAFKLEKDGKTYTIDDANYPETMKHCADREVREKLCRARATRAPENAVRIDEILRLRGELAKLLGFSDYAALSLSTKCAPSVKAVRDMIAALDTATAAIADREEAELVAGADLDRLEPWDRAFYAERLRERKYAYSEEELKRHFEFEAVLAGLFRMTKFLFDIEVTELTGAAKPSVWHPDVRFFAVKENGAEIAHFYLDPYVRNGLKRGGAWMNEFRNRSDRRGETPLAVLVLNLPEPDAEGRCFLPMRETETLFHEFGHALQCMLTREGEEDAAGINLVEWDAVEVASQFMENWCLDDRTGIVVPEDLKAKVRAAKNFRAATACRRQLAFAKTDLDLHEGEVEKTGGGGDGGDAVKLENFAHFGLPTVEGDRFLCAFSHIFAGGYAAGYYGYKWAEVMSADCYGAFEEAGLADDAAMKRLGAKYRETVLGLGGGKSALEVFRDFRGREPAIDALLRQQDLKRL